MDESVFIENIMGNICLTDPKISLEAKGLYYSALINACSNQSSLYDLFKNLNEDEEFIFKLIDELVRHRYLVIGIPINDNDVFIFKDVKEEE